MMPPPMTSRLFGTSASASAPVESITRGSTGKAGNLHRLGAGGDDGIVEGHGDFALRRFDLDVVRCDKLATP